MLIRLILPPDAKVAVEVHHAAVRQTAAKDYPVDIIEQWAPLPVTDEAIEQFNTNQDGEIRFLVEIEGTIVGIGAIVVSNCELRACYVAPEAGGKGVGTALLARLEQEALQNGLSYLQMDSSLTAEPFYKARGYKVLGYGHHVMRTGDQMACVHMRKELTSDP